MRKLSVFFCVGGSGNSHEVKGQDAKPQGLFNPEEPSLIVDLIGINPPCLNDMTCRDVDWLRD